MDKLWQKLKDQSQKVIAHFSITEGFLSATALAYTTLLSLVPLMILSLALFSLLPSFKGYVLEANELLVEHFVPTSASLIADNIATFAETATKHSVTSLLFALFSSLILIYSLESAFNLIWQVRTRRPLLKAIGVYLLALVLLPLTVGILIACEIFLYSFPLVLWLDSFLGVVSVLVTSISFFLLYKLMPNCVVKTRQALIGALIAAILFELLKSAFGTYITHFSSFTLIYGTLAAIPIFLTWLYFSWIVVLLGGVIAFVGARK